MQQTYTLTNSPLITDEVFSGSPTPIFAQERFQGVLKHLISLAPCHIVGLSVPDKDISVDTLQFEDFCVSLLDNGALSIQFQTSVDFSLTKLFLAQFPKTRTGIISTSEPKNEHFLTLLTEEFKDVASYFTVIPSLGAPEVFKHAKELVSSNIHLHVLFTSSSLTSKEVTYIHIHVLILFKGTVLKYSTS